MEFSDGAWWLLATLAGIAVTVISYFLKRTISKTDDHDRDINKIKQTYVTKTELDAVRSEIRDDVGALKADVKEIKENTLTKADFLPVADRDRAQDRQSIRPVNGYQERRIGP